MKIKVYPYKAGSKSARSLANEIGSPVLIRHDGGYVPGNPATVVVNWGNSSMRFTHRNTLNKPEAVAVAANKLSTLDKLLHHGVPVPEFTTDKRIALGWLDIGCRVFARTKLSSHTGDGIVIIEDESEMVDAPLYTKYQRKDKEYRVHVFKGKVIDITEKRKRYGDGEERPGYNPYIRNLKCGWVFCRDGVRPVEAVKVESVRAVQALGLDFGAVDIIEYKGKVWTLEVNSAPGLEGTTLQRYKEAILGSTDVRRDYVQSRRHSY